MRPAESRVKVVQLYASTYAGVLCTFDAWWHSSPTANLAPPEFEGVWRGTLLKPH